MQNNYIDNESPYGTPHLISLPKLHSLAPKNFVKYF